MIAHDPVGDRQAQAEAATFAATVAGFIAAVEAIKDMRQILAGDAGTRIADRELNFFLSLAQINHHNAALLRILDGVRD